MKSGHETHRVDTPAISKVAMIFGASFLFVIVTMYALWREIAPHSPRLLPQQIPPSPQLQAQPTLDKEKLYEQQRAQLEGYGWVDENQHVAHIPIERAMALLSSGSSKKPDTKVQP